MIRPIQFRKNNQINMNLLKSQLDRRVLKITMMIKGINYQKPCSDKCCKLQDNFCQTQEQPNALRQIQYAFLCNTPSMKSLKSPQAIKKSTSKKDKQNISIKSQKLKSNPIQTNKPKKILKSIKQSQNQGLKTSRYNKMESNKKKITDSESKNLKKKQQTLNKKKLMQSDNKDKKNLYQNKIKKTNQSKKSIQFQQSSKNQNSTRKSQHVQNVITSFQSTSNRKSHKIEHKLQKKQLNSSQKTFQNLCFSNQVNNLTQYSINQQQKVRRNSFNDNTLINSSTVGKSKGNVSSTLNSNLGSNSLLTQEKQYKQIGPKRICISQSVFQKISKQVQSRLQKRKPLKQPRTNNIRSTLLKKLQDRYLKAQQVVN